MYKQLKFFFKRDSKIFRKRPENHLFWISLRLKFEGTIVLSHLCYKLEMFLFQMFMGSIKKLLHGAHLMLVTVFFMGGIFCKTILVLLTALSLNYWKIFWTIFFFQPLINYPSSMRKKVLKRKTIRERSFLGGISLFQIRWRFCFCS